MVAAIRIVSIVALTGISVGALTLGVAYVTYRPTDTIMAILALPIFLVVYAGLSRAGASSSQAVGGAAASLVIAYVFVLAYAITFLVN